MSILDNQTHHELETWRRMLSRSLAAISVVEGITERPGSIRLGGGTVLSAMWGHRHSKDVDLFTNDAQILAYMRPWLNDDIANLLGEQCSESANSLKFEMQGGAVDIVAASDVLPDAKPTIEHWNGYDVLIEDPAEIIAKKLYHRSNRVTLRDYVDIAEGLKQMPGLADRLRSHIPGSIKVAAETLKQASDDKLALQYESIRFIGDPIPLKNVLSKARAALAELQYTDEERFLMAQGRGGNGIGN